MNYRESSHAISSAFSESNAAAVGFADDAPPAVSAAILAKRVLQAPAQDPHVLFHNGLHYYCESNAEGIFVRYAADFLELANAPRKHVWKPQSKGPASKNIWAPELQWLDGRCYIYFAADDGKNENHRMWVLAAATDDPAGRYELVAELNTEGWAIDGTVLVGWRGDRYFVWSGWAGARNGQQNLYISHMESPLALCGGRVLLAEPDQSWERRGMPICEGPQILQRAGRTFIVYSASGSWTEDYCLGLLAHDGDDLMNPECWKKVGPVFQKNEHAWGVGHCGFVDAADGTCWVMYHAKTSRRPGWNDREVRAQTFAWSTEGMPVFGQPLPSTLPRRARAIMPTIRRTLRPALSFAGLPA